jgi:hypothetical protein
VLEEFSPFGYEAEMYWKERCILEKKKRGANWIQRSTGQRAALWTDGSKQTCILLFDGIVVVI